jgi:hypothetical protein
VKDYRSVRDEIFRRAEVKKKNRRQKIVRGATVCLLLCLCLPVSLWAWQTGASLEEPPLYAPEDNEPGAPASGENEEQFQSAAPDASGEPEAEASEEPPMEEEPIYSEEPWEEESALAPDEPEVPEGPGEPADPEAPAEPEEPAPSLPQGVTVELYLFDSNSDHLKPYSKIAVGVIGVTENGKWNPAKGYILLTEDERVLNGEGFDQTSLLEELFREAGLNFPAFSLTAEEGEELLEQLLDYYS